MTQPPELLPVAFSPPFILLSLSLPHFCLIMGICQGFFLVRHVRGKTFSIMSNILKEEQMGNETS